MKREFYPQTKTAATDKLYIVQYDVTTSHETPLLEAKSKKDAIKKAYTVLGDVDVKGVHSISKKRNKEILDKLG